MCLNSLAGSVVRMVDVKPKTAALNCGLLFVRNGECSLPFPNLLPTLTSNMS